MGLFDIFRVGKIKAENNSLKQQLQELHADEYFQVKARLDSMTQERYSSGPPLRYGAGETGMKTVGSRSVTDR